MNKLRKKRSYFSCCLVKRGSLSGEVGLTASGRFVFLIQQKKIFEKS